MTDNYLMQIGAIVVNALSNKDTTVSLNDLKLEFTRRTDTPRLTVEDETAIQQAFWIASARMQATIIRKDSEGNILETIYPEPRKPIDPQPIK